MWISRQICLAGVLATLCLTGCSATGPLRADLPLAATSCHEYFPFPWEIRAVVSVQIGAAAANVLVALATTGTRAELAVLTPQGIPLYRFTCSQGPWQITKQARTDLPVEPERLIAWLQLVYLDEARVSQWLQPGWDWSDSGTRRDFRSSGDGGEIHSIQIERAGSDPWYATARLEDSGLEAQLVIRILEASRVLPE